MCYRSPITLVMPKLHSRIDFHSSPLDRLRWLIEFSELKLPEISASAASRWYSEAQDMVMRRPGSLGFESIPVRPEDLDQFTALLTGGPETAVRALPTLQPYVVAALDAAKRELPWELPYVPTRAVLLPTADWDGPPALRVSYTGTFVTMFVYSAIEALVSAWPSIRVCGGPLIERPPNRADECQRIFIPDDRRQQYCSPACSSRARKRRYLERQTPRHHHGRTMRQRAIDR